jgi:hypothetical protein
MRKSLLLIITLLFSTLSLSNASVIYVQGNVYGIWSADTVIVTGEISIPSDSTLIIESGVKVLFQAYCKFIVNTNATLIAAGTEQDSILFDEYIVGNHWKGIRFIGASDSCRLEYCHLTKGYASGGGQDDNGGAIYCSSSSPTIAHSTIDSCSAYYYGGGIYCTGCDLVLDNLILWGNFPQQIAAESGSDVHINYSDIQDGWPGLGNINAHPLFADPINQDYYLQSGSPCIDTGDPNPIYNDPDSTRADMGCYPYDSTHTGIKLPH